MQRLAEVCIKRPVFAVMLIATLTVVGAAAYFNLGVDRLPSVDLPTVSVRTSLPGAAPEEVENEVTKPIEDVVNTVDGVEELRSISTQGSSIVIATFSLNRDINDAAQDVRDRVATVLRRLPDDADPPVISKFNNDSQPVMSLALSGPLSIRELTEIADKVIKVDLERAAGVGEIAIVGGAERTINIWIDADRLAAQNIPATAVRDALSRQNADIPGGNVTGSRREQTLRTMGKIEDPAAFNDVIVATVAGTPVRVRDIGRAEDGQAEQRSSAMLNGTPAVSLDVRRQSGANTVAVIEGVKARLERVRAQLPAGVRLEVIRDQSNYIFAALHEINVHLVLGSVLASIVVLAFMRSWRSTLIAAVAIPTSLIATFGVMWALDFTLNSVTMLALVLMVGVVIDDAIVVLENIYRFAEEKGLSAMDAAREGTREIGLAVLATTLSLVVIFVPVSFMSSISGRFVYQFGITAAVAVLISLLVSFTLTPMLASRTIRAAGGGHGQAASRRGFYAVIDRVYGRMLGWAMRFRIVTAVVAALIMASSVPLYSALRQDYLPSDVDEGEFQVSVNAPSGTAFTSMQQATAAIDEQVRAHPAVALTLANTGGGFSGQVNQADIYVRLIPFEQRVFSFSRLWRDLSRGRPLDAWRGNTDQTQVMQELRRSLRRFPDVRISVRSFPAFNIGGGNNDIDFNIRGPELERIAEYANRLRTEGLKLPGLPDLDTTLKLDTPELRVDIDREKAADLGVSPQDVGTALRLLVGGDTEVTRFRDRVTNEDYDVRLRLIDEDRRSARFIPRLLIPGAEGNLVELRNIAEVRSAQAAARIDRLDRQRAASVRGSVGPGYALQDRIEALRAEVEKLDMPPAYSIKIAGKGRELERTFTEFLLAFALSMLFMYMILAANYESYTDPLTILLSIPLSVPFAFLSLLLLGGTLNLYSALGLLVLFGVVKKNAILQIDHMNHLRAQGVPRAEAIMQGNRDRLRPILMTTLALVGGMIPLALGTGPGAQERRAIAIVVIGGQSLCLLVTLLVTPVVYSFVDDARTRVARRFRAAPPAAPTAPPPPPPPLAAPAGI
ncbi:MAG TPA: efflux RND transporter permease subunit [Phycisphaerales bacterium]|nr:efflux RND transporter permease subunit [Phycisphaerales bacterium]